MNYSSNINASQNASKFFIKDPCGYQEVKNYQFPATLPSGNTITTLGKRRKANDNEEPENLSCLSKEKDVKTAQSVSKRKKILIKFSLFLMFL
jgi:hypothetical protein